MTSHPPLLPESSPEDDADSEISPKGESPFGEISESAPSILELHKMTTQQLLNDSTDAVTPGPTPTAIPITGPRTNDGTTTGTRNSSPPRMSREDHVQHHAGTTSTSTIRQRSILSSTLSTVEIIDMQGCSFEIVRRLGRGAFGDVLEVKLREEGSSSDDDPSSRSLTRSDKSMTKNLGSGGFLLSEDIKARVWVFLSVHRGKGKCSKVFDITGDSMSKTSFGLQNTATLCEISRLLATDQKKKNTRTPL